MADDSILARYGMGQDPWAWRSNMDAPRNALAPQLKEGPAPSGYDRVFDAVYGWLGGTPGKRATANALASAFDIGTLGMATGAYDGGQTLAQTGSPAYLAASVMPGMRPAAAVAKAAAPAAREAVQGIRAYHGSPHDFDRFDISRIGTGEGAQAYGHGLYFAEAEGVAKAYRDQLGDYSGAVVWKGPQPPTPLQQSFIDRLSGPDVRSGRAMDVGALRVEISRMVRDAEHGMFPNAERAAKYRAELEELRRVEPMIETKPPGRMYEVQINADPEHFLDWDKPLSQQPEAARRVLERELQSSIDPTRDQMRALMGEAPIPKLDPNVATPHDVIRNRRAPGRIEDALKAEGIPGIKYLDQGSRDAGAGSRNYVVFDDALIEILRKYGLMPPAVAGAAAASAPDQAQARQ